jgi:malate/lactate dehydrogenase
LASEQAEKKKRAEEVERVYKEAAEAAAARKNAALVLAKAKAKAVEQVTEDSKQVSLLSLESQG